jgi:hypothetical protein
MSATTTQSGRLLVRHDAVQVHAGFVRDQQARTMPARIEDHPSSEYGGLKDARRLDRQPGLAQYGRRGRPRAARGVGDQSIRHAPSGPASQRRRRAGDRAIVHEQRPVDVDEQPANRTMPHVPGGQLGLADGSADALGDAAGEPAGFTGLKSEAAGVPEAGQGAR